MEKEQLGQKSKEKGSLVKGNRREALRKNLKEARLAVRSKFFSYIAAGFGLVIGFAWNDAISSLIKQLFPDAAGSILAKFIYAVILTVTVAFVLFYLEKVLEKETEG